MAYIGNTPVAGAFKKLDNIQASFNGVTTTFPLTVGTVASIPGTPQNLLISISAVLQEPVTSYTISGANIVFSEAPLATDTFFGVQLGSVGEVGTVADGAITGTKLAPGAAVANIGFTPYNATNPSGYIGAAGAGAVVSDYNLRDIGSVFVDKGTVGTGTVTFDYTGGSCQRLQVSGALTIALSNWPASGNLGVVQLELVNAGVAAVTFPVINWILKNGTFTTSISTYLTDTGRNTLQSSGTDFIMVWSRNGGTTVYGKVL